MILKSVNIIASTTTVVLRCARSMELYYEDVSVTPCALAGGGGPRTGLTAGICKQQEPLGQRRLFTRQSIHHMKRRRAFRRQFMPGIPAAVQAPPFQTYAPFNMSDPNSTGMPHRQTRRRRNQSLVIVTTRRTTAFRHSFTENCDYLAYYCLRAYETGKLCARSFYYVYHTFPTYCLMDYVNCMEKNEVWQVMYMGDCLKLMPLEGYRHYPYEDDYFLDEYYIHEYGK